MSRKLITTADMENDCTAWTNTKGYPNIKIRTQI